MKVKELTPKIEKFLAELEEHAEFWEGSLDEADLDHPAANKAKLREQTGRLARQLGMLRPYLDTFGFPTIMSLGEVQWDIYDSAVSNGAGVRKGKSLEAVSTQLHQALGRLDSLNPDDDIRADARPAQGQPQAATQPVTIYLQGAQSRVNVQSTDHSTNVEDGAPSGKSTGQQLDSVKVPTPRPAANPEPAVKFLGISAPMVDRVFDVRRRITSFHPEEGGEFECVVACFRNEVIYGKPPVRINNARAHLKSFDANGLEIGGGVSHGFWLNHSTALVDLIPGTTQECVILLLRDGDKFSVPTKTRGLHRGYPITGEKFLWDMKEPPESIQVNLLGSDNQFLLPPLLLELDRAGNRLMYRLKRE